MDYVFHLSVMIVIYSLLSASLELLAGRLGLMALCQAAFYGLGAYVSTLLLVHYHWDFFSSMTMSVLVAAVVSALITLPSLRLVGDYFAIATFSVQIVLWQAFNNLSTLTGGPMGISGIPPPQIFKWSAASPGEFLLFASCIAGIVWFILFRIVRSPFGRVLLAIREDEPFVFSLGKNPVYFKAKACAISAGVAAVAGSLYASYSSYIDPTSFTVMESILILSMVIIGGAGSLWGSFVGASVLVGLPEVLRFVGLPSAFAADLRQIIYGSLLVIMMMFRPRGLLGRYNLEH
jgi:branched-chain amino acid transport system permease protein